MKKTLWCNKNSKQDIKAEYYKVTATKVDELSNNLITIYMDENGNKYYIAKNRVLKRFEFVKCK